MVPNSNCRTVKCAVSLVGMHAKLLQVVSDYLRPHRLQPTRLLCPWESPGKNTGVGGLPYPPPGIFLTHVSYVSCIGRQVLYHLGSITWEAVSLKDVNNQHMSAFHLQIIISDGTQTSQRSQSERKYYERLNQSLF